MLFTFLHLHCTVMKQVLIFSLFLFSKMTIWKAFQVNMVGVSKYNLPVGTKDLFEL